MATSAADTMTMYSTSWCGYCRRLKSQLEREGIAYTEVDIESQPAAAEFVMQVNNGNQTVPTVLFPDGTAATNPSLAEVKARLGALPAEPRRELRRPPARHPGDAGRPRVVPGPAGPGRAGRRRGVRPARRRRAGRGGR